MKPTPPRMPGRPPGTPNNAATRERMTRAAHASRGRPSGHLDELLDAWAGGATSGVLALRYGVSHQAISRAVRKARGRGDPRAAPHKRGRQEDFQDGR